MKTLRRRKKNRLLSSRVAVIIVILGFSLLLMPFTMFNLLSSISIQQDIAPGLLSAGCDKGDEACALKNTVMPVGAIYEKSLYLPVIGDYTVQMHILSGATAKLVVGGGYSIEEDFRYKLIESGWHGYTTAASTTRVRLSIELSPTLKDMLNDFGVTLSEIQYNSKTDSPSAVVGVMSMVTFPIELERAAT